MTLAYYNEIDPYAAQWLRNLSSAGLITRGVVDTRSIVDVQPADLNGFAQCHFFAGIGGWSLAARLAGWPDDRPLWTGSCPCQPFSVAGKGAGQSDARHLWPELFRLVAAIRPPVLMGEQVAAAVGKSWLDGVHTDLESIGYACGTAVVPACAVNAPHRRDRLWFVADDDVQRAKHAIGISGNPHSGRRDAACGYGPSGDSASTLADDGAGRRNGSIGRQGEQPGRAETERASDSDCHSSTLADMHEPRASAERSERSGQFGGVSGNSGARISQFGDAYEPRSPLLPCEPRDARAQQPDPSVGRGQGRAEHDVRSGRNAAAGSGFWLDSHLVHGADGKARRVGTDFRRLFDGFLPGMAGLRTDVYAPAIAEIVKYGSSQNVGPAEVLRALWQRILSQPAAYEALGEQTGISQSEILLAYLCELHGRGPQANVPFQSAQELRAAMRSVRIETAPARTSRQRRYFEQCAGQYSDALQTLSWVLAQHAQTLWTAYRTQNAAPLALLGHEIPARIGKLRALGNAIVPQVAAEVIAAYMDCRP